jgi:hypothetical protein
MAKVYETVKCCIVRCPNHVKLTGRAVARWGKSPPCEGCRHVFHYWEKRVKEDPEAAVRRAHQLSKWQHRMVYMGHKQRSFRRVRREIAASNREVVSRA